MRSTPADIAQVVTGIAAGMALLYFLRSILIPVVVAFVLAVLVDALVRSITRRPRAPGWGVAALAGIIIGGSAFGAIYVVAQGGMEIVQQGPALIARLERLVEEAGRFLGLNEPLHLSTLVEQISIPRIAGGVLAGLQGVLSGLFLMIIYFGFMLASRSRTARKMPEYRSHLGQGAGNQGRGPLETKHYLGPARLSPRDGYSIDRSRDNGVLRDRLA